MPLGHGGHGAATVLVTATRLTEGPLACPNGASVSGRLPGQQGLLSLRLCLCRLLGEPSAVLMSQALFPAPDRRPLALTTVAAAAAAPVAQMGTPRRLTREATQPGAGSEPWHTWGAETGALPEPKAIFSCSFFCEENNGFTSSSYNLLMPRQEFKITLRLTLFM